VEAALAKNPAVLKEEQPLMTMLTEAFEVLQAEDLAGSCTASLALLTEDAKLHVLNVGDSGIHILRNGQCIFQTGDQQHYFNCPYQLGMGSDDRPADAGYFVLEDLEPGDVIVAATDGVWDNLHQIDMLKMVSAANSKDSLVAPPSTSEVASQWSPEVLARAISEASHLHGKDDKFVRYTHSIYVYVYVSVCMCVSTYINMYMCLYVCMYTYIYMYLYIDTHTHTHTHTHTTHTTLYIQHDDILRLPQSLLPQRRETRTRIHRGQARRRDCSSLSRLRHFSPTPTPSLSKALSLRNALSNALSL
jgi:hypothetical protein